ncbi:MAG TPA: sigma-70 family RNA polymerase sigma factor [Deltaproteobacteria bacterium]|nr:sigma-70 family RNA polymerase sigma factor [Deltaproteobacteria bacterium]
MIAPTLSMIHAPPPEPSDEALVCAFHQGDERAFERLYDRYNARITSYAARLLQRREAAEDVCTETFVRIVQRRWRPGGSFRSFLFTVAHRLCLDRLRAHRRHTRLLGFFDRRGYTEVTAEDHLVFGQRDAQLQRALATLPEIHRAAVLLTYTEGLTSPEVGRILGCTDQQVRSKLSYARRKLREELEAVDG